MQKLSVTDNTSRRIMTDESTCGPSASFPPRLALNIPAGLISLTFEHRCSLADGCFYSIKFPGAQGPPALILCSTQSATFICLMLPHQAHTPATREEGRGRGELSSRGKAQAWLPHLPFTPPDTPPPELRHLATPGCQRVWDDVCMCPVSYGPS